MCKQCTQAFRLTPFHHLVLNISEHTMSPTTRLKVSFELDLDKLNYARELRGLQPITLYQLQDQLAAEGSVRFHDETQECAWYADKGEVRWNVI